MSRRLQLLPPIIFLVAALAGAVFLVSITPPYVPEPTPTTAPEPVAPRKPLQHGLLGKRGQEVIGLVGAPDKMTHWPQGALWVYPDGELHYQSGRGEVIRVIEGQ